MQDTMGKRRTRRTLAFTSHEEKLMRNNWNFSHSVSDRTNAFGSHDASTTGNSIAEILRESRAAQLKDAWIRRTAQEFNPDTGTLYGFGGALVQWEETFGK
jgi:hypothetical protein